jgi:LPS export ABC transporter protein LptC
MKKYYVLLLALLFAGCYKKEFNPLAQTLEKKVYRGPSSSHSDFSLYSYDNRTNMPSAIIKAKKAVFFRVQKTIFLTKVTAFYKKYYFTSEGQIDHKKTRLTQLTCDKAEIDQAEKIFTGMGNVVVISKDGIRLETKKIFYDEKKNMLYTDKKEKVIIYNKNGTITKGIYLRTDPGMNIIMLDKKRTATPDNNRRGSSF